MSRMIDVFRRGGMRTDRRDEQILGLFDDCGRGPCKVFEVTNVWQYVASRLDMSATFENFDPRRDFPTVTPPFGLSWWEWKVRPGEVAPVEKGEYTPDALGVAVETLDLWDEEKYPPDYPIPVEVMRQIGGILEGKHVETINNFPEGWKNDISFGLLRNFALDDPWSRHLTRRLGDRIRWICSIGVSFLETGDVIGPMAAFIIPIAPDGSLLEAVVDDTPPDADEYRRLFATGDRAQFPQVPFVMAGVMSVLGRINFGIPDPPPEHGEPFRLIDVWTQREPTGELQRHVRENVMIRPGEAEYDESWQTLDEMYRDRQATAERSMIALALYPFLQAVAFTHLRNATVAPVDPPAKLSARHRRKHGKPLARYHTIEIEPLKVALAARRSGVRRGAPVGAAALHIPRGHFAHYGQCCETHERKGLLFGKHEGKFWIPEHLRGNAKAGVVIADYEEKVS